MMKRKTLSIVLAVVFTASLIAAPCGQAHAAAVPGIISSITIAAPWDPSITFTFTDVYELCEVDAGKIAGVVGGIDGTMLISKDVTARYGGDSTNVTIKGNTVHKMLDLFRHGGATVMESGNNGYMRLGVTNDPEAIFNDVRRKFGNIRDFAVEAAAEPAQPPATEPPAAEPPATEPPAAEPPASEPPATEPPAAEPPAAGPQTSAPPLTIPSASAQSLARPTASTVLVNGQSVSFDAYNINGNNYFKLRDLAFTLSGTAKQFEVAWDGASNAISLTTGLKYSAVGGEMSAKGQGNQYAAATSSKIYLDGDEVAFTAFYIMGNNYFKLRDIGQTFDFGVDWDGSRNTIVIDTSKVYVPEGAVPSNTVNTQEAVPSNTVNTQENDINKILEGIESSKTQSSYLKNFQTVPEPSSAFGLDPNRVTVREDTADLVVFSFNRKGTTDTYSAAFEEKVLSVLGQEGFRNEATTAVPPEYFVKYITLTGSSDFSPSFNVVRKGDIQIVYVCNGGGDADVDVFIVFKVK